MFNKALIKECQFILVDYNNEGHRDYLSKRKYLIEAVEHLVEYHKFRKAITHLAVSYMDSIILTNPSINNDLIAYVCFIIASKFHEYDPKIQIKSYSFNKEDVKKCEIFCLKALSYKLDRFTAYDALEKILQIGIISEKTKNINYIYRFAIQTLNKFLYDERYVDFSSIQICLGVVAFTREHFNLIRWTSELATIYNLRLDDFMNCYFVIKTLYTSEEFILKLNKSNNEADYIFPGNYEQSNVYSIDEPLSKTLNVYNQDINLNSYFNEFPFSRNHTCMYYKDFEDNINTVYNLYNSILY